MDALKRRIEQEGQNLGRGILKIDSFLNHQIDANLMEQIGEAIAAEFAATQPTRVLTAEVSGLIPAAMAGKALGNIPVVYARKKKPITMMEPVYVEEAPSHTKGGEVELIVSPEYLRATDRVILIDDFLATGLTINALAKLIAQCGATLCGIGCIVEKSFEGGRAALAHLNVPIVSLAIVDSMEGDTIEVREPTAADLRVLA